MAFYVRRSNGGREAFTGSLAASRWGGNGDGGGLSREAADREAQAWRDAGWTATVEQSTAELRAEIRASQAKAR
jgi:hypothetical protein